MKSKLIIKAAAGVALLWLCALVAIHVLNLWQPTATSVSAWAQRQQWSGLEPEERAKRLSTLADQMNQLSYADRQTLSGTPGFQSLTKQMTNDEKVTLLDKTLSKTIAQIMDSLNRMKPDERRRLVNRALARMQERQDRPPAFNNPEMQKVVQTGFTSYLQNASAETKLDVAPLIEQIQVDMQGMGN